MFRIPRGWLAFTVVALGLGLAGAASADNSLGLRGGMSGDPDQVLFGVHYMPPPVAEHLYLVPSVEAGLGDDAFSLSFNGDLQYQFTGDGSIRPYAGGGIALFFIDPDNFDSDTEVGLNALGGLLFDRDHGWPIFVEFKLGLMDEVPDFKIVGGLMFR